MYKYPILLLFLFVAFVFCHEVCIDSSYPGNYVNSWCTDYSGHSCCNATVDAQIQQRYNGFAIPAADTKCQTMMHKIFCGQCDPWAQHIYGMETGGAIPPIPHLCPDYCAEFYDACAFVPIQNSPWSVAQFGTVYDKYFFCKYYAAPTYQPCYNGSAYSPPPFQAGTDSAEICVEQALPNGLDPNIMIVSVVDAKDGTDRLFVNYKRGDIQILKRSTLEPLGWFMNLSGNANFSIYNTAGEAGLTSLVFHPQYAQNGRFFVHYSTSNFTLVPCTKDADCETGLACGTNLQCVGDHVSVVAKFRASATNPNLADISSKRILMKLTQPYATHNHGQLLFGPEGYLYLFWGDGGSEHDPLNRGQTVNTSLSKVMRIDIDHTSNGLPYAIPTDNPYYGNAAWADKWETWAVGLRNPWSCAFDSANMSTLLCGDVGQETVEEINQIVKGGNYGWRVWEGTLDNMDIFTDPMVPNESPLIEYSHSAMGGSPAAIGGYVYRGSADHCLYGRYLFADWQGPLFAFDIYNATAPFQFMQPGQLIPNTLTVLGTAPQVITAPTFRGTGHMLRFGEDANGDVYLIAESGVFRIVAPSRCGIQSCGFDATSPPTTSAAGTTTTAPSTTLSATTTDGVEQTTASDGTMPTSSTTTSPGGGSAQTTPQAQISTSTTPVKSTTAQFSETPTSTSDLEVSSSSSLQAANFVFVGLIILYLL